MPAESLQSMRDKEGGFPLYRLPSPSTAVKMPKFGLKMNSQWSNVKLKSQTVIKFYNLPIH